MPENAEQEHIEDTPRESVREAEETIEQAVDSITETVNDMPYDDRFDVIRSSLQEIKTALTDLTGEVKKVAESQKYEVDLHDQMIVPSSTEVMPPEPPPVPKRRKVGRKKKL
jgi:archaellum component FlaC